MSESPTASRQTNPYRAFLDAVAECYEPLVHPDYAIELAAYNAGQRDWPPCERCAWPIRNAHLTGAMECEDCRV